MLVRKSTWNDSLSATYDVSLVSHGEPKVPTLLFGISHPGACIDYVNVVFDGLDHVKQINDGCILNDIPSGGLATGNSPEGRPAIRFMDI